MSHEITRMYASAATAAKAADELREEGFDDIYVVTPPAASDVPLSAIAAQIAQGHVLLADARIYAKGVAAGHSLVTVHAPFGSGKLAEDILESHGPVDSGMPKPRRCTMWDEAAPLSSALYDAGAARRPGPDVQGDGHSGGHAPAIAACPGTIGMPLLTDGELGDRGKLGIPLPVRQPHPAVVRAGPAAAEQAPVAGASHVSHARHHRRARPGDLGHSLAVIAGLTRRSPAPKGCPGRAPAFR